MVAMFRPTLMVVAVAGFVAVGPVHLGSVDVVNASNSISLDEPFTGGALNDPSDWISIRGGTLLEWPCLLAASTATQPSTGTIEACANQSGPAPVATGEGALRLTRRQSVPGQAATGTLLYTATLAASEGIDISFEIRMDDGDMADGMSFFLKDGANASNVSGTAGGALGYGLRTDVGGSRGVPGGLVGIGFDKYGSFSSQNIATGCATPGDGGLFAGYPQLPGTPGDQIVMRGPDTSAQKDGSAGYCYLAGTNVTLSSTQFQRVRVVVPPYTPGQQVPVSVYLASHSTPSLLPLTPTLTQSVTLSATSFKFGFSASSGYWSNNHDLRGLLIRPAGPEFSAITSNASTGSGTGPTSGGTLLTITGTNIATGATVTVDGQACTNVVVSAGNTQLTCTTPPGTPGAKQVVVTNPNGGPGFGTFTYTNPIPTITSVDPASGVPAGGNTVTLTGTGFVAGATATLGGQACTNVVVVSSTSLTCAAPAGTEGAVVDVTVTNVGAVSGTGVALYTYRTPPTTTTTTSVPSPATDAATASDTAGDTASRLPATGGGSMTLLMMALWMIVPASLFMMLRRRTT